MTTKTLLERIASEGSPARTLVSKAWRRYARRNLGANDNHAGLDRLYALPDPWGMTTERERSRFQQTNAVIESLLGRVDTLLEIGSGEGHQSEYLARLCTRLDGVDVSTRAVARARERVPQCRFGVGEVTALPWSLHDGARYDLVVACEVLYYLGDIPRAVERMSQLGRSCFVTFFCPAARVCASHLEGIPGLQRGWIYHDPYAWLWASWQPQITNRPRT
jgi:2-polyprenyl-3-methyl-5-hydroxy-6-metoxy-1,4-benzoquinol methylase